MPTTEVSVIKKFLGPQDAELHHSTLYLFCASHEIRSVIASGVKKAIYSLLVAELNDGDILKLNQDEFRTLLERLDALQEGFSETRIIMENTAHALIPEALFAADKASDYLKLNTQVDKLDILFNRIQQNKVSLFGIEKSFNKIIRNLFPHAHIHHGIELFVSICSKIHDDKECLFVQVNKGYIDILQMYKHEPVFLNSFKFEADTDIIYFILSVAEIQKLNTDQFTIFLMGHVSNTGSLVSLMKKYIPTVELIKRVDSINYPASFREFHDHQYFLPLSCLLCEL